MNIILFYKKLEERLVAQNTYNKCRTTNDQKECWSRKMRREQRTNIPKEAKEIM
jgi:hypothetical protein